MNFSPGRMPLLETRTCSSTPSRHFYGSPCIRRLGRGDFELAVTLAHDNRALENGLGVEPAGSPSGHLGTRCSCWTTTWVPFSPGSARWIWRRRQASASRIVHARYMGAVVMTAEGDLEGAANYIARARELAAVTGSPTDLASVAVAEGFASRSDEGSLAAFLRADELARMAGNRWMGAFALTEACGFLVHLGDLPPAPALG